MRRVEKPVVLALFACWIIGFSYQAGRSSQHQEDRKKIEATNKTSHGIQGQQRSSEGNLRPNNPGDHQTENRTGEAPEISFMGLKFGEGLLIFVTIWLVLVTKALVDGAKDTAERQLRAYVLARTARVFDFGTEKIIQTQCIVMNFGQTPAYDVTGWVGVTYDEFPIPLDLPRHPAGIGLSQIVLGPRGKTIFVAKQGRRMTGLELQKMRNGASTLYIYGEMTYRDVFGARWKSHFRFMYGGPGGENSNGKVSACADGNYEEKI